ncbi:MAG: helix-turn-helix transcriptional regulator [Chitinophagaceae bacterium]|nr:helix-turn-helix transcriptional regulator [Chitinophagaceae bacterium]
MRNNKPILTPVKREDFKENFGGNTAVENIQPQEYFQPTINLFKKLAVGKYFWFIADTAKGIFHSSGGMLDKILPIKGQDMANNSPEFLFRNSHPDDITRMFSFTNYWILFFMGLPPERKRHVHPTIYIRMLNPEQQYKWVMVQYADNITDAEGRIAYGLTFVTDISHIKKDGAAMMSILDSYDESCQHFFCADGNTFPDTSMVLPNVSNREIEVLKYLAIGYSSKQIAAELNIAVKTTDNHRQNLLRKTNTKSSGELVAYGINMGYI